MLKSIETTCIFLARRGIDVEVVVSRTHYSADLDDELREDVGDVVVKDGEASVRTDPTSLSKED